MAENHFEQHGEWIKVCDRLRSEWSQVDIGEPIEAVADLLRHWPADWSISNDVGNNEFWVSRA